jgi:hypothetical protein
VPRTRLGVSFCGGGCLNLYCSEKFARRGFQVTGHERVAHRGQRGEAAGAIPEQRAAILRSIVIVLSQSRGWMRAGRRPVADPTISAVGGLALLKSCEPAIPNTVPIQGAPRIVLSLGGFSNADNTDANAQHKQQEPHARLLVTPAINAYARVLLPVVPGPSYSSGGIGPPSSTSAAST